MKVRVDELETILTFALSQLDEAVAMQASLDQLERRIERFEKINVRHSKLKRPRITHLLVHLLLSCLSRLSRVAILTRRVFAQPQIPSVRVANVPCKQPKLNSYLILITKSKTWFEAQTKSGKFLYSGILKSGGYQLPCVQSVRLRASRPDLVVVVYGSKSRQLGTRYDTGWHEFTPPASRSENKLA